MHSSLMATADGLPLSLAAVKFWTRKQFKGRSELQRHINPTRVPIEQKESWRSPENMRQSNMLLGEPAHCIHIGDRESDIYELFYTAYDLWTHFLDSVKETRRNADVFLLRSTTAACGYLRRACLSSRVRRRSSCQLAPSTAATAAPRSSDGPRRAASIVPPGRQRSLQASRCAVVPVCVASSCSVLLWTPGRGCRSGCRAHGGNGAPRVPVPAHRLLRDARDHSDVRARAVQGTPDNHVQGDVAPAAGG